MVRLGALSDEMTPVVSDLGDVAPDINRFLLELGPFSQAGIPALDSLGEASKVGTPARRGALPVLRDLRTFASAARPVGSTLADVLESFQRNDGIERFMDYLFFQAAAVNGFDSFGHYLRAALLVNQCSTLRGPADGGLLGELPQGLGHDVGRRGRDAARPGAGVDRPRAAGARRRGSAEAGARTRQAEPPPPGERAATQRGGVGRRARCAGDAGDRRPRSRQAPAATPQPAAAPSPTATPAPANDGEGDAAQPLLDYLFGGDG